MAISVVLKNEAGTRLAQTEHPYIPLVSRAERGEYPILGHVDPYGNTIFNRRQMDTLLVELQRIRDATPELDGDRLATVRELGAICAEGLRTPHRFLWFIGD